MSKKGKITGIGGIFFKCSDPNKSKEWYSKNLNFETDQYGHMFQGRALESDQITNLQWSPFDANTKYFEPSSKEFMINYRVENIEVLIEQLKANGVEICDKLEEYSYGKFIHIMDLDGNKIELWEPKDDGF